MLIWYEKEGMMPPQTEDFVEFDCFPSAQKMDSSISAQLGMKSSKGVGSYVPPSMLWPYRMYLELRAQSTYMKHNMIMHFT